MSTGITDRRVLAGFFLAALLLLAAIFFISTRTTQNLIRETRLRDHDHSVIEQLQSLLGELDDAETAERDYVITGDARFLAPYRDAASALRHTAALIHASVTDAQMRQAMNALEPVLDTKLGELQQAADLRRERGFAPAKRLIESQRAPTMHAFRQLLESMRSREESLLAEADAGVTASTRRMTLISLAAYLVSFVLLLVVFLLLNREIAERRRTEAALRASEERYRLVSEQVKDYSICMMDPKGHIMTWNAGSQRIKGYSAGEIIGKDFSIFYLPEDVAAGKPKRELEIAEAAGRSEDEGWRLRKDGSRFWANVNISGLRDEAGKLLGFTKITRDNTERKHAEDALEQLNEDLKRRSAELEASNKELEAFTYSVSHDLRAPLRHVDGFSKMLLEESGGELSQDARRYLGYVREGVIQMGQLVDDLLGLARVGRKDLSVQATGLNSLVEEVVAALNRDNPGRSIEWKVGSLPFVECDAALMKQVFANLLSNAVKYTRPRTKAVIEVGTIQENGRRNVFVRDNGVGFNMKYADKLFGVFQRLHRPEDFEGTGVGLATVQRIIHKHGGRVWAEAELDRGATFFFTLGDVGGRPESETTEVKNGS